MNLKEEPGERSAAARRRTSENLFVYVEDVFSTENIFALGELAVDLLSTKNTVRHFYSVRRLYLTTKENLSISVSDIADIRNSRC